MGPNDLCHHPRNFRGNPRNHRPVSSVTGGVHRKWFPPGDKRNFLHVVTLSVSETTFGAHLCRDVQSLKFYQAAGLDTRKKPAISTLDFAPIGAGRFLSAKDCPTLPSLPRKPPMRTPAGDRKACETHARSIEKSIASLVLRLC
jgi:hypothetical protein